MSHQESQENKYSLLRYYRRLYAWFAQKAQGTYASVWLGAIAFTDSSFFLIPPDPLLVALVYVRRERWVYYALLTTITSVAGAVFGYAVGMFLFEVIGLPLIELYGLTSYLDEATVRIDEGVFWFTFIAAFTIIPFKLAVLVAGFTQANFIQFLVAAIVGRGLRYFLLAILTRVFGAQVHTYIQRFWVSSSFVAGLAVGAYVLHVILR